MKKTILTSWIFASIIAAVFQQNLYAQASEVELWKLSWRMVASSIDENYEAADLQLDSLLNLTGKIQHKFLTTGLKAKYQLGKEDEIIEILNRQGEETLKEICPMQFLADMKPCAEYLDEQVENKSLQMELIQMFVDDQAARGNLRKDLIHKYNLDTAAITQNGPVGIDNRNKHRLSEIIEAHGFPTRMMVGKDAMHGVFTIIQHADRDKEWQKSQLKNIEEAVKAGDMDAQSYAYLYDRIKINQGEKQLYGTQFAKVDPINKTVELAETEDMENLDERRRQIGMMPVEMYKQLIFKNL